MESGANKKFAKIYDKHIDKIYRFVFLKTGSKELAEDLTSQVFAKGWKKFKLQGAEIENMSAYLFQIARAEVASHYREEGRFKVVSAEVSDVEDEKSGFEALGQADGIRGQDIQETLKKLDEDLQNIVIWHYVEGLPFKEIGKFLNRPEGTVRVMAHRALKELKECLQKTDTR